MWRVFTFVQAETLLDEVRDEEGVAYNYRKELADMEIQLKKQQNLYHAVRNDKNILNKGLTEAHDEISDLKGKLRVLNHQFDQVTIKDLFLHWFGSLCVDIEKWQYKNFITAEGRNRNKRSCSNQCQQGASCDCEGKRRSC